MTIASDRGAGNTSGRSSPTIREWHTLIADNIFWNSPTPFAWPSGPATIGGGRTSGHATWFVGAVENFRFFFFDHPVVCLADPQGAVAEVKGQGLH